MLVIFLFGVAFLAGFPERRCHLARCPFSFKYGGQFESKDFL